MAGCENFDLFPSEDSLNQKIQSKWRRVIIQVQHTTNREYWTFSSGKVYRLVVDSSGSFIGGDTGSYSISTKINDAILDISDFRDTIEELNARWDIVSLDDDILIIATDYSGTKGILQREFYKE